MTHTFLVYRVLGSVELLQILRVVQLAEILRVVNFKIIIVIFFRVFYESRKKELRIWTWDSLLENPNYHWTAYMIKNYYDLVILILELKETRDSHCEQIILNCLYSQFATFNHTYLYGACQKWQVHIYSQCM